VGFEPAAARLVEVEIEAAKPTQNKAGKLEVALEQQLQLGAEIRKYNHNTYPAILVLTAAKINNVTKAPCIQ
jgi:hypothetical protein